MLLFKERNLNIAILLSASWHLFFIASVSPVLLPERIDQNNSTISFLGSIMERINPANERSFVPGQVSLLNKMDKFKGFQPNAPVMKQADNIPEFIVAQRSKEQLSVPAIEGNAFMFSAYSKKEAPEIKVSNFLIRGEARDRTIIYRPGMPRIFILPSDFNSDYSANIRFRISRFGFIKNAECITSSGSSEIDQAAIRYIRRWQFVPSDQDNQEGIIRVSFDAP